MSETLSQAELDALLKDVKQGAGNGQAGTDKTESKRIRHYDFSKPNIFGRDQMRMLNIIHDDYGSEVSGFMTRYLKELFLVELESIEAMPYRNFIDSLSNPSILSVIEVPPLRGSMILDFPSRISSIIIDSVLGGFGDSTDEVCEFTDIELSILKGLLEHLTESLKKPWEKIISLQPSLEMLETNPQMVQTASSTDIVIIASYKSSVANVEDYMKLCIPHSLIEPIAANLGTKQWPDKDNEDNTHESGKDALKKKIMNTGIEVRAELGKNTITLGDLTNLQAGDVISLGKNINSKLDVYIGDSLKFTGKPGIRNSKYSIEISKIIKNKNNRQV